MSIAASLITGLLAGGTSLLTYFLESEDISEREEKAEKMYGEERAEQQALTRYALQTAREERDYQRERDRRADAERAEERSYGRQSGVFNTAVNLLNNNAAAKQHIGRLWGGK